MAHGNGKHVAIVGPVQRDCSDRAVFFVQDGLVAHECFLLDRPRVLQGVDFVFVIAEQTLQEVDSMLS